MRHHHRSRSLITRVSLLAGVCLIAACSSEKNGSSLTTGGTGTGTGGSGASTSGTGATTSGGTTGTGGAGGASTGTGGTVTGTGGTVAACNGIPIDSATSSGGTAGGGTAGGGGMAGGGAPATGGTSTSGGGSGGAACTGVALQAERIPVDLFLMMDRSISMSETVTGGGTRWQALHDAVQAYVQSPGASDIGTGLGFFSKTGTTDDTRECDVNSYAQPVVGIGALSTTGPQILTAMDGITPGGLTPTVPALKGAIQYAKQWATAHPQRQAAVTLITDGYPTQCDNQPSSIAAAAADGFAGTPSIPTYVIGVGKIARFNLEAFAQAGGTGHAYVVDDGDVTSTFVDTIINITGTKLACDYKIPDPASTDQWIDYSHVQLVYTPASGGAEEMPYLDSASACATSPYGGWYYDIDPNSGTDPTTIHVCPCSCARFGAGQVEVRIGCRPAVGPR